MAGKRKGLGRGLDALIKDGSTATKLATTASVTSPKSSDRGSTEVALNSVVAGALQPRHDFDVDALNELVQSVREHGILQPLLVRAKGTNYELVAGERRYRAAKEAGLKKVPVILIEVEDEAALEIALIENLQRQDLNPIEEAEGYALLQQKFGLTQANVAQKVGKGRASIANALRLLDLPNDIRKWLSQGKLSVGHAKVLMGANSPAQQKSLAANVIENGLSVRALEQLLKPKEVPPAPPRGTPELKAHEVKTLRSDLNQFLGTNVRLKPSKVLPNGHHSTGSLEIDFSNRDDLERLLKRIGYAENIK